MGPTGWRTSARAPGTLNLESVAAPAARIFQHIPRKLHRVKALNRMPLTHVWMVTPSQDPIRRSDLVEGGVYADAKHPKVVDQRPTLDSGVAPWRRPKFVRGLA